MLENRSFDHMLGHSGLTGTDAASGQPTRINGPSATDANSYQGASYTAGTNPPAAMPVDPGHEFLNVVEELCGQGVTYPPGGPYPSINNSGFVSDYAVPQAEHEGGAPVGDYGQIMQGFPPDMLPVLNTLAKSFAVCDSWFASIPGPTWPNRFFAYAASSGGLDHSPSSFEIGIWEGAGYSFPNGTIFDALSKARSGFGWRIYAGDHFPVVGALAGISHFDIQNYSQFASDIAEASYPWAYTFIEPNYGDTVWGTYENGNSQHPLDGVTNGEALIKATYEAIRNSPHWETSLLIITYDEHGGFYDHVAPPAAVAPNDGSSTKNNKYGFDFKQYGVRVPAVVISPLIPASTIDHRVYDHTSILATVEKLFGLTPLTARDAAASTLLPLLSLSTPRADAPTTLPQPAAPGAVPARPPAPPDATANAGNVPGFLHVAMVQDLKVSPPEQHPAIKTRVASIQTRGQAAQYMQEVRTKLQAARVAGAS
jgi:phospholipase C